MREGAPAAYEPKKEAGDELPPKEAIEAGRQESANPVPGDLNPEQSAKLSEALQSIRDKYGVDELEDEE
jgi:hypothetical protein